MNDHAYIDGLEGAAPFDESESLNEGPLAGPHNLLCEMAVLGALLHNNEVYTSVADFLAPEHFWEPLHADVYQVACELIEQGSRVDSITIQHYFHNHEGMRALGGANVYFAYLAASCPVIIAAPGYARIIAELAARRRVINTAADMRIRASSSKVEPVDDIFAESIDLTPARISIGQLRRAAEPVPRWKRSLTYATGPVRRWSSTSSGRYRQPRPCLPPWRVLARARQGGLQFPGRDNGSARHHHRSSELRPLSGRDRRQYRSADGRVNPLGEGEPAAAGRRSSNRCLRAFGGCASACHGSFRIPSRLTRE
jgi:hypothetical protein